MGVFSLIHRDTKECLITSTRLKDVDVYLTVRQKEQGEYYIEVREHRGHLCNAEYKTDRGTWILVPKSNIFA